MARPDELREALARREEEARNSECPQGRAFLAVLAHCRRDVCAPCAALFSGVGEGRHQWCDEYRRLEAEYRSAPCTCPIAPE